MGILSKIIHNILTEKLKTMNIIKKFTINKSVIILTAFLIVFGWIPTENNSYNKYMVFITKSRETSKINNKLMNEFLSNVHKYTHDTYISLKRSPTHSEKDRDYINNFFDNSFIHTHGKIISPSNHRIPYIKKSTAALVVNPAENTVKTAENTVNPAENTVNPAENTVKTAENTVNPAENTVNPAENTVNPAENTVNPAENTVNPAENTVNPAENTVNPAENTVNPAENTVNPAENTVKTAENTVKTAENTVKTAENTVKTAENTVKTAENTVKTAENTVVKTEAKKLLIDSEEFANKIVKNFDPNKAFIQLDALNRYFFTDGKSQNDTNTNHQNYANRILKPLFDKAFIPFNVDQNHNYTFLLFKKIQVSLSRHIGLNNVTDYRININWSTPSAPNK
ncbi:ribosomal eL19 family protein [Candidatus Ishikawella capsulata]|uniref:Uncharacterized protein n=1 Tax=Candidatus Ishikawaella capsulata Mpkobe TaxID=476281 RepID=C5WCL9_9ENTR|nr:hypothetical protein [Candidatus Ishikawaella capsulata]BAH83075.1 hypothetical protein ICMP_215 [Candidatus Ishikawaella capsulata Mpkobe]